MRKKLVAFQRLARGGSTIQYKLTLLEFPGGPRVVYCMANEVYVTRDNCLVINSPDFKIQYCGEITVEKTEVFDA